MPDAAPKAAQAVRVQPIEVPSIPLEELRDITDNFGPRSLIGEGSYGRVYHGVLRNGKAAALKKLDDNKQPEHEFLSQVCNVFSNLCSKGFSYYWCYYVFFRFQWSRG